VIDGLNPSQKAKRKKLQESFLLAFFFFIKRKHNLMSTNERLGMDDYALNGGRSLIEKLLFEHVSSQMKLTHAFEHVIAARSVSPLSMLHHIGTSSETSSLVVPSNSSGYRSSGLQSGRSSREYSASPAPHAHVTEITSPPVTRQLVESVSALPSRTAALWCDDALPTNKRCHALLDRHILELSPWCWNQPCR